MTAERRAEIETEIRVLRENVAGVQPEAFERDASAANYIKAARAMIDERVGWLLEASA